MKRAWPYIIYSLIAIGFTIFYLLEHAYPSALITLVLAYVNIAAAYIVFVRRAPRG